MRNKFTIVNGSHAASFGVSATCKRDSKSPDADHNVFAGRALLPKLGNEAFMTIAQPNA